MPPDKMINRNGWWEKNNPVLAVLAARTASSETVGGTVTTVPFPKGSNSYVTAVLQWLFTLLISIWTNALSYLALQKGSTRKIILVTFLLP